MIARDETLSSLFDARRRLTEFIVAFAPDPIADPQVRASQAAALEELIMRRDQVSGAINAVIAAAFKEVATPELLAAAREVRALADRMQELGKSIENLKDAIGFADEIVKATTKVVALV